MFYLPDAQPENADADGASAALGKLPGFRCLHAFPRGEPPPEREALLRVEIPQGCLREAAGGKLVATVVGQQELTGEMLERLAVLRCIRPYRSEDSRIFLALVPRHVGRDMTSHRCGAYLGDHPVEWNHWWPSRRTVTAPGSHERAGSFCRRRNALE